MAINRDFLDELEGGGVATLPPQDYIIPPAPVIPKKKETGGINYDFLDSLEADEHPEVIENKAKAIFDPEGIGYDYETAKAHGLGSDETGHWPSRVPQTGQVLKGQKHPTYSLTLEEEKKAGYEITKGRDGKYYSQAKAVAPQKIGPPAIQDFPLGGAVPQGELIDRGGKQFVNRLVLDTVESWRPSSLYVKGSRINAARMKNYRELGDQWEDLPIADKVTKFPQYLWADIRALYGNESRAKQAIAQAKLQKERGAYRIQLPPPEGAAEKAVDVVAGLSAFITKLWLLKKVGTGTGAIPKQSITGDMAVWEALGLAEQDIPGKGAAVRGALGVIGKTPIGSLAGKVAKTGAESALFAGVTAATGGSVEDIIIASLVPVAFNAWGFAKQRQHITQYEQNLKSKALAAHQQRVKSGMSRPTSEAYLKADQRVITTAVAKAKQAIYHDDAFATTKDKWEVQRQKALKMVATGKPKQVQRGKDILRFLELKPGEIPPEPIAKQIQEAKRVGEAVRGEKFKPPTKASTERPVAPKVGVKPKKGIKLPPEPTEAKIAPKVAPTPVKPEMIEAAFKLKDGRIIETGYVHALPENISQDEVAETGFIRADTKEFLTREETEELIGTSDTADLIKMMETSEVAPPKVQAVAEGKVEIPKEFEPLAKDARKFKTAKEFISKLEEKVRVPHTQAERKISVAYGRFVQTKPVEQTWREQLTDFYNQAKPAERKPAKEAWEMGITEHLQSTPKGKEAHAVLESPEVVRHFGMTGKLIKYAEPHEEVRDQQLAIHKQAVRKALSEGKPVPKEVLEEYKSEKWAQEALKEKEQKDDSQKKERLVRGKPQGEEPGRPVQEPKEGEGEVATGGVLQAQIDKAYKENDLDELVRLRNEAKGEFGQRVGMLILEVKYRHLDKLTMGELRNKARFNKVPTNLSRAEMTRRIIDARKPKAEAKKFYTSVPEEWREHPILADWGKKGIRTKGNYKVGKRKTFIYSGEFEKIPTRLSKATMDALKAKAGEEMWYVTNRKRGVENYYLVPKQVVAEVREELGEEVFERGPKREPTKRQRITYAIQSMVVQGKMSPDMIGEAVLDLAKEYGLTEAELTDNQKGYIKEYQDAKASGAISEDIQERERQEVRAGETKEERKERVAIQEEAVTGEIGERLDKALEEDFLEGIEGEKPRQKELEELSDAELKAKRNALPKYKNDMNLVQRAVADAVYLEQLRRYKGKVKEYNKKATEATGLKHGDIVGRFQPAAFGAGGEEYTGKVIYDKNGRLVIRTDRPDGTGRKTFPINKGWKKVEPAKAEKKQPTDLIGRPILKGGASGKQLALGIYADKVPPTDVPTKTTLQNAVATALNEDYKKVRATKKKYKGVKDEKQLYEKHNFPNKLFIHPESPYPEMRAAWTIATKGKGLFGGEVKGAAGGASVAVAPAEMGGGYGTIAPNEQSTFAEKTQPHRVAQELPDKTKINVLDELLKIASPAHRVGSREGARVLRKNLGKLAQETVVAHKTLRKIHHALTFMNRDDIYDFIDRLETGQEQLSPRLTQIAAKFRSMLDERRDAVQALGKGQLENFYENYFPHIWKDPKAAEKAIRQIFGRRRFEGSKSFLKKRTIMTVKEGRDVGLELVSENPVDLVLLKLFEMDRYLMAHHVIQDLKFRSLIKFVYSRSPSPEGYKKIDDRAFTVYMPPEITKKEAYDSIMVDQLMDIARSLGIDAQRFVTLGKGRGRWWGYAKIEEDKVRTRYAGPEGVLTHEIGHILNSPHRYNVYEILRRAKEGSHKEIARGKHKGEQKFVPTEEAVKHRKVIDVEWRALADARIKGQEVTKGFKKYVRKTREKEAVMLEALIHAPEEFKRVAPTLYDLFVKFLNAHSELRPILDIKPSLVLGSSEARIPVPGFTVLGHYYAPEPVAKILNNYLSPGLRNNENILIASGYNMTRMMANVLNQAQLALSGFHAINVTTDMMASTLGQGIRRLTVKGQIIRGIGDIISTPISPILRLWDGVRLRRAYGKQIDTIEDENLRNLIKAVVLADGRDRMDPFYYNRQIKALQKTISDILKGSPVQKIKGVGKLPFNTFGATLEALAAPLMQWYVPTGKLGLFAMLAEHEMQRAGAGQINAEQLHERLISSWDSVDNRMGQLVYDNLFWNKTLKDVAMLAVRSVGWNLGSWREYGGVPVDILGTKGRLERGDVLLSQKMAYTIGAIILYGTLGAVTMYLLTGKAPEELKDYFFPKTGRTNPDGSDERISFPTYAKDWFAYGTQPVKTVTHKIHPLWGLLTDLVTNKDFFDVEVRHPGDPISQQMLDFTKHIGKAFISISMRNYMKMQKTDPKAKKKNFWVSITGVVSAPAYITRSPAQKLMYRYIIERIPDKARTKESFEKSLYRKRLKTQLRKGEPIDRREAIRILGKPSFNRMVTDAKKVPFAESFSRLTLAEALNVYAIAAPKERAESESILKSKYRRARNITDDMKAMYKELIK